MRKPTAGAAQAYMDIRSRTDKFAFMVYSRALMAVGIAGVYKPNTEIYGYKVAINTHYAPGLYLIYANVHHKGASC